ncbi:flagellar hook-associated protein FlgK [Salinarimonas soli]|uniref:Flagellar hook-associated protein 1 n=1 Tax=Salinarimonas soli TaxID=1638099 RepID=A0A5B2VG29_9HYPH|nr:flagellar hook-associated protein FlgK [Salinarimonas soli]KAA2237578.1 flagellar hook-associated protein FlgK [Salinarimonas soli]
MSLGGALNSALSGLRTTQAGINVVSQNVANAGSVGYSRRQMSAVQTLSGTSTTGVRAGEVQRILDVVAQRQLRLETSAAGYTGLRADYASSLERLFGQPGAAGSLDKAVNDFTGALQSLMANPGDPATRAAVLDRAGGLASLIGATADGIQSLRTDAEGRIGGAVRRADDLLQGIQALNARVITPKGGTPDAALLDERDRLIDELSGLMDVQVSMDDTHSVRLSTQAGQTLFDGSMAVRLSFDGRSSLGPDTLYATDATRGVGTISAQVPGGAKIDLIARGAFRSGEIGAAIEMRDDVLVQAQRQLDELAAGLAVAGSETRREGVAVTNGFQVDTTGSRTGDVINVSWLDAGGVRRDASFADASAAQAGLGPTFTVTASGGTVSIVGTTPGRVLGASFSSPGTLAPRALADRLPGDAPPLFTDRFSTDTTYGGVHPSTLQVTGLAQRLGVNPGLLGDPKTINGFTALPGDATRATAIVDNLTRAARAFTPATGVGGANATYAAPVTDFARRVVETQAANAESAGRLDEGQRIALSSVEARFADKAGVNIDEEMAQLVQLQTAYGANARVMSAVRDMLDMLLRI